MKSINQSYPGEGMWMMFRNYLFNHTSALMSTTKSNEVEIEPVSVPEELEPESESEPESKPESEYESLTEEEIATSMADIHKALSLAPDADFLTMFLMKPKSIIDTLIANIPAEKLQQVVEVITDLINEEVELAQEHGVDEESIDEIWDALALLHKEVPN
jgi:hypothetical protein